MTAESITRYVRYTDGTNTSFGILEGETIQQLDGDLLADPQPTGRTVQVSDVRLLVPIDASRVGKVIGVPGNYNRPDEPPRTIIHPRWFNKFPTSLNPHEGDVELPPGASNLNFEGELVVIIGKEGRFIPLEDVPDHVFGVTVGNDWSENTWMGERNTVGEDPRRGYLLEPNRMIAKSMDTWACMATTIVCGLAYDDYMDLGIEIRLNGELAAKGRTKDMTNSVAELIHYLSYYCTLVPGDIIYTGTVAPPSLPGIRRQMQDGDVVEVEIEKVGLLRNRIVAMTRPVPEIGVRLQEEGTR